MQKTGRLFAHRLGQLFIQVGYATWICKGQNKGVDLKVYEYNERYCNTTPVLVAEVLNWSPKTNIADTRLRKIIRNLSGHDCHRVLIYTTMGNEHVLNELRLHNISTLKIGYQVLPKHFYQHFVARRRAIGRRIDSRETTLHIKSVITEYMQAISPTSVVLVDVDQEAISSLQLEK